MRAFVRVHFQRGTFIYRINTYFRAQKRKGSFIRNIHLIKLLFLLVFLRISGFHYAENGGIYLCFVRLHTA